MIPILYEKDETEFTSNGLGRLYDVLSCVVTEERNGIYEVEFEYPVTGHNFNKIIPGRIIACEHDYSNDIQPFDIVSYSKPINGIVSFHAVHISYRQSRITASGTNINSLDAAFRMLSAGEPSNPFFYSTDKEGATGYLAAADGVPRSVKQLLGGIQGSILDVWGGEYEFNKFSVRLWNNRGSEKSFAIRYGVNMVDFKDDGDYSGAYTSCVPYWTGDDGNGGQKVVKGRRVDSGFASYNDRNECVPLDLTEKFETIPTPVQLESAAASYMNSGNVNLPSRSISVDFVRLQDTSEYKQYSELLECGLCDSIRVIFPRYNVEGVFKIVKIVYNVLLEKYDSVELGNLTTSLSEALGISSGTTFTETSSGGGTEAIPGVIQMFGGSSAPEGWLLCDGSAVSRTDYSKLFSVLGTTYGSGDGSTTFNIPDLRNRFPVGAGDGYSLNSQGGENTVKLSDAQMAHGHGFTNPSVTGGSTTTGGMSANSKHSHTFTYAQYTRETGASTASALQYSGSTKTTSEEDISHTHSVPAHTHTVSGGGVQNLSGASSTRTGHENRPPYIGLNFIICTGE